MTKKQKLTLAICGILMTLVVIGLSIAIVIVASTATVTANMSVRFTSYEVSATITCSGYVVDMTNDNVNGIVVEDANHPVLNTPASGVVTFTAGQGAAEENVEFNEVVYTNAAYRLRYQFEIKNTGAKTMRVECSASDMGVNDSNMSTYLRNFTDNINETNGALTFNLVAQDTKMIYFFVYVTDPAMDGYFEGLDSGSLSVVLTGLDQTN